MYLIFHQSLMHASGKLRVGLYGKALVNLSLFCYLWTEPKDGYQIRGVKQSQRSDSTKIYNLTKTYVEGSLIKEIYAHFSLMRLRMN